MRNILFVSVFVFLLSVVTSNQGNVLVKGKAPSPVLTPSPTPVPTPTPTPTPAPTPSYVITNRVTALTTRVGLNFLLKFYGNITTGSNWYLTSINTSRLAALNLSSSNTGVFVPFTSDAGSPGYSNFLFQALSATSRTTLEFAYIDVNGNVMRRRTVNVRILS